jgi:hypothetical protein
MARQQPEAFQEGTLFWIPWMTSTEVKKWWKF